MIPYTHFYKQNVVVQMRLPRVFCVFDFYFELTHIIHKFSGRMKFMAYHYLTWWVSVQYQFSFFYATTEITMLKIHVFNLCFLFRDHRVDSNDIVISYLFLFVEETYSIMDCKCSSSITIYTYSMTVNNKKKNRLITYKADRCFFINKCRTFRYTYLNL